MELLSKEPSQPLSGNINLTYSVNPHVIPTQEMALWATLKEGEWRLKLLQNFINRRKL